MIRRLNDDVSVTGMFSLTKHPLSRIPTEELDIMDDILSSHTTLSVYCDSSVNTEQRMIGLGVCFVGDMATRVESKKLYLQHTHNSAWAEIQAVAFALELLPSMLSWFNQQSIYDFTDIAIFSDFNQIENLELLSKKNSSISRASHHVLHKLNILKKSLPDLTIDLRYLGTKKKHNIYHRAAHNAARKIINKR